VADLLLLLQQFLLQPLLQFLPQLVLQLVLQFVLGSTFRRQGSSGEVVGARTGAGSGRDRRLVSLRAQDRFSAQLALAGRSLRTVALAFDSGRRPAVV
jgi:hypothetical protein